MELQFKPDAEHSLQRWEAWWHGEVIDRPVVSIGVKPDKPRREVPAKAHETLRDRWLDMDYHIDRAEAHLESSVFYADSFPVFMPNVGPELVATLFGCELNFGEATSWSDPVDANVRDVVGREPNYDNPYWQAIEAGMDRSIQRGAGKWITGLPDFHFNGDLLAALRDPEALCFDYVDDIEGVKAALEHVDSFTPEIYDRLYAKVQAAGQPATTWLRTMHMGRAYVPSCDFICMISPEMFTETIIESIRKETAFLDRAIFHLDGPGALRHLDALLELNDLHAIQWVFGAGNGPAARWIDVYKKIQAAGKGVEVCAENADDALAVAEHLRPEGVWFAIGGSYTAAEADAVIAELTRRTAGN